MVDEEGNSVNPFLFPVNFASLMLEAQIEFLSAYNTTREKDDSWKVRRSRDLREMHEEGFIEEPEAYGFNSYAEMFRWWKGRGEANNSFEYTSSDRKMMNNHSPRGIEYQIVVKCFPEAFLDDALDIQRTLESVTESNYWNSVLETYEIIEEYGRLLVGKKAELPFQSEENEELLIEFMLEDQDIEIRALYRDEEESYSFSIDSDYRDLPDIMDEIPRLE